jgi:isoquinoline 1-oxidoreductase beta subunit
MNFVPKMNRRSFLVGSAAVAGGGLALGIDLPSASAQGAAPELGVWVVVKPDDSVVVRIVRAEMGQGTITGPCTARRRRARRRLVEGFVRASDTGRERSGASAPGAPTPPGGSRGIREVARLCAPGRRGGTHDADARRPPTSGRCRSAKSPASAGVLTTRRRTARSLTASREAASKLPVPEKPALKDPKDWKIAGKPLKRFRTVDKVTGKQVYGADFQAPGMLNATIKESPVFGGKVKSFDAAKVAGMKGVKKVLQVGDTGVAVVADTWWQAKVALDALPIVWDEGPNAKVSSASIAEILKEGLNAEQAFVGNQAGDAKAAIASAAKKIEAVYSYPYQNHAPMEPMNATARYTPERCEVWVPTQDGEASFAAVLAASGLPADKCEVHMLDLGGGFGRRGAFQDYVHQAVRIAKEMPGTPIKLLWSREEDMAQGRYHPVMMAKMVGAFDKDNNLTGLHIRLSGQSILASVRPQVLEQEKGRDPLTFQGLFQTGRAFVQLHDPEPADRPCDAQPARPAGILARREHQPERHLHGMLHG